MYFVYLIFLKKRIERSGLSQLVTSLHYGSPEKPSSYKNAPLSEEDAGFNTEHNFVSTNSVRFDYLSPISCWRVANILRRNRKRRYHSPPSRTVNPPQYYVLDGTADTSAGKVG